MAVATCSSSSSCSSNFRSALTPNTNTTDNTSFSRGRVSRRVNCISGRAGLLSLRGTATACCYSSSSTRGSGNNSVDSNNAAAAAFFAPPCLQQLLEEEKEEEDTRHIMRLNQNGTYHSGGSVGSSDQSSTEKVAVAVDVDEVLGSFISALNRFIADRYSMKHSISEYHVYEFFKIWNCSRDEADIRVHEFFKTSYFRSGIYPIPGARQALQKLSRFCNLSVVTSLGAKVLIDDNPRYAIECAEAGMRVLLFDYENSYPWCKTESVTQHPLVTKVHNWEEVEHELVSWIVS
ncbi:hypothetical protein RJ640_009192 [Escallonia rubra]|uniref:Tac7077 n=1 Tax=Escallonia rubra TaxID=112253 RepID=A0AA88UW45_9ASTE|nr:hypothetical protein RJ640_009192 [Escallonia rubra]